MDGETGVTERWCGGKWKTLSLNELYNYWDDSVYGKGVVDMSVPDKWEILSPVETLRKLL